jgi:large subunit ribosomal protein L25
MSNEPVIVVSERTATGVNASRRVRAEGKIPAVVYGAGKGSLAISVDRRSVLNFLRKEAGGENAIFLLRLEGTDQERHAMIKEMQVNPQTREIVHLDFVRLVMDEKLRVTVPIELVGTPVGVKNDGGVLDFVTREVEVECLPANIPPHLEADVSALHIGDHVEASAIELPENVVLIEDQDRVIASVGAPRRIEEESEEGDDFLLEATPDEPEVIGKGGDGESEDEDEG